MPDTTILHSSFYTLHSEPEISPVGVFDGFDVFFRDLTDLLVGDLFQLILNHLEAQFLGLRGGIVHQIFRQSHQGVGMAAIEDLAGFAQAHKPVAGAAQAVAGCAEGRNVMVLDQPSDHLLQGPLIRDVKLLGIVGALLLGIAAHGGPGRAAGLGNTQAQDLGTDSFCLAGGDDHTGIGHGNADAGYDLLKNFVKVDEDLLEELEELLIMADVGVGATEEIIEELRDRIKDGRLKEKDQVLDTLKEILSDMIGEHQPLNLSTKPSVILVVGVNGVGKTTSIGKISKELKSQGKKVVVAAADTFRAAAAEQLSVWCDRAGVDIIKQGAGADPAAVVFDAIGAVKSRGADVLIIDTAGRLHNKKNLMDELAKINRVISRELPDAARETLLVLDATTGQNAVIQAREFRDAASLTGLILTKLDGTAKGGIILSIKRELGIPVKFIGVGEQIDDMKPFSAEEFANALFEGGEGI